MSRVAMLFALALGLCCAKATAHGHGRLLKQSSGPNLPVSATSADLINDPTGRGHLLAALGNPMAYSAMFQYNQTDFSEFGGTYNAPVTVDPTAGLTTDANQIGSYRVVGNSGALAIHALPFPNDLVLFMQRPSNNNGSGEDPYLSVLNGTQTEIAAFYNLTSNTFTPFHITEHPFCSGHVLLPNGEGIVFGGDNLNLNAPFLTVGFQAVRVVNAANDSYSLVGTMQQARWYPSVVTMADGNLLVAGGMQQEAGGWAGKPAPSSTDDPVTTCSPNEGGSIADPGFDNPTFLIFNTTTYALSQPLALTILLESWPINSYPYLVQLPTGSVLIIAGTLMEALYFTADGATLDAAIGDLPVLPVPVNYPQYNSLALLPLSPPNYETQVLMAGGSSEYCASAQTPAGTSSFLVDVTPGADHNITTEQLAFPRVMGDLVLLPDGRVFLCNGAQVGIGGGSGAGFGAASTGATVAEIYDPSLPVGQRWSTVADSKIWRLYHSVAFLTPNAEVFIAGSEVTAEHRVQLYTPDYLQNGSPRPVVTSAPTTMVYGSSYNIGYSNVSSVDRVVLNRLAGSTHGNHFDQRQVVLACTNSTSGSSTACIAPPNSSVAPPGVYMLFVLSNGVPSVAPYVSLQFSGGLAPAQVPAASTTG